MATPYFKPLPKYPSARQSENAESICIKGDIAMIVLQLILYCALFIFLVKCAAKSSGLNCLYFYPKEYIDEAQKRGLADKKATMKKGRRFMLPFCIIMLAALLLITGIWNRVSDFKTAYLQTCLFLVAMNWFDGIVIDTIWVRRGKIWKIDGMEGVSYTKPLKSVFIKRGIATIIYLVLALPLAGLELLIAKI